MGHAEAQYKMANLCWVGYEYSPDTYEDKEKEQGRWMKMGAENGHAKAQYELATYYELGIFDSLRIDINVYNGQKNPVVMVT